MHYKRTPSSYIYISILVLYLTGAQHLDAASGDWASLVSGYAQSAWNALPSREQVLKSVNPFDMSSEQRRNLLLYLGIAGAAGAATIAGRQVYNRLASSANPIASDHNSLLTQFNDIVAQFDAHNVGQSYTDTQVNLIKNIWQIKKQFDVLYESAVLAQDSDNANIIKSKIMLINHFLSDRLPIINIYGYDTLNILSRLEMFAVDINEPTLEKQNQTINALLANKRHAARYARSITDFSNKISRGIQLTPEEIDTITKLDQKIKTVLKQDRIALTQQYKTLKKHMPQKGSPSPSYSSTLPTKDEPTDTPAPLTFEASVTPTPPPADTGPQTMRSPSPTTPSTAPLPVPIVTTATQPKPSVNPNIHDLSKAPEGSTLPKTEGGQKPSLTSAEDENKKPNDQQEEKSAQLLDELEKIHTPETLKEFSQRIAIEDLSANDRDFLKQKVNEKQKAFTLSIRAAAETLKPSGPATTSSTSPDDAGAAILTTPKVDAPATAELTTTEATNPAASSETPSLASASPASTSTNRTAHITVTVSLIKSIKNAKSLDELNLLKADFEDTYKPDVGQKDIETFQKAYDEKYKELSSKKSEPEQKHPITPTSTQSTQSKLPRTPKFSFVNLPTISSSTPGTVSPHAKAPAPKADERSVIIRNNTHYPIVITGNYTIKVFNKKNNKWITQTIPLTERPITIKYLSYTELQSPVESINLQYSFPENYMFKGPYPINIATPLPNEPIAININPGVVSGYTITVSNPAADRLGKRTVWAKDYQELEKSVQDEPYIFFDLNAKASLTDKETAFRQKIKSLNIEDPSDRQESQLLQRAGYYMLAGSQLQREELVTEGKRLNDLLRSNKADISPIKQELEERFGKHDPLIIDNYLAKAALLYYKAIAEHLGFRNIGTFLIYNNNGAIYRFFETLPGLTKVNAQGFEKFVKFNKDKYDYLSSSGNHFSSVNVNLSQEMGKDNILFNKIEVDRSKEDVPTSLFITLRNTAAPSPEPIIIVPDDIVQKYNQLINNTITAIQNDRNAPSQYVDQAEKLRLRDAAIYLMRQVTDPKNKSAYGLGLAQQYAQKQVSAFKDRLESKQYSYIDKRIGENEVILTDQEFNVPISELKSVKTSGPSNQK